MLFPIIDRCASCAPTYYDIYTGGFAAFFRNALSECDSVGLKVNLTTKVPGSDTFSNVNTGNGSLSGLNKTSGTSSTYKINTIAILAISGPLASVLLL